MIRCSKCGVEKLESEFHHENGVPRKQCKDCRNAARRERYRANPEPYKAASAAYHAANPLTGERLERWRQYAKNYFADPVNKKRQKENCRRWMQEHRQEWNEAVRRYRVRKIAQTVVDFSPSLLNAKWDYWDGRCWMCGGDATSWDHIRPLAKGGLHCLSNLRPACGSCNSSKQAKWPLPSELVERLRWHPAKDEVAL